MLAHNLLPRKEEGKKSEKGSFELTTPLQILLRSDRQRHNDNLVLLLPQHKLALGDLELVDQIDMFDERSLQSKHSDRVGLGGHRRAKGRRERLS